MMRIMMMMIMRMMSMMIMIKIVNQIEKIVTTIALPDRSEVEELSSDYAQSILDKVFIIIVIVSAIDIISIIIITIATIIIIIAIIITIMMPTRRVQWLAAPSRTSFNLPLLKLQICHHHRNFNNCGSNENIARVQTCPDIIRISFWSLSFFVFLFV